MNQKSLYSLVIALIFATLCMGDQPQPRPNILFILADDLGWSDTTLYGHTQFHQTPNLERLARRGMTFTRAYSASPLCSPTRSAILTGLSPARTGITTPSCHVPQVVLQATVDSSGPPDQKAVQPKPVTRLKTEYRTLAESLKDAGYATGHFGKWHLGPDPYSPLQQGFDIDLPHHPGPGPAGSYVAPWKFNNFKSKVPAEHIEDRMAQEAVAWLEQNRDRPFYLNYWMFSVHAPFDAKSELIEKHRARVNKQDLQQSATYAAMIESMDDAVGTLLNALDRLGLADNTIVVFTSDNGGNMYSEVDGTVPTSNRPLRGGKATMYEGGTRVPCVVSWPGVTQPGSRSDAQVQSEDYYPTLLSGLDIKVPEDQIFDGQSILPALRGKPFEHQPLFQYFPHSPGVPDWLPPAVSVHSGDWKLIRIFHGAENQAHRYQLFKLDEDLSEQHNLATEYPQKVQELDGLIERFLHDKHAVVPQPNSAFDPTKYRPEDEGKSKRRSSEGETKSGSRTNIDQANDNPKMLGWKTRSCVAQVENGIALIQGTGQTPFLGFAAGKLETGARLRFRLKCDGGRGQVAWVPGQKADPGSTPAPNEYMVKAGSWTEISTDVRAVPGQPGIIRLFLPSQDHAIELDWIELTHGTKKQRWDF